jgi:hypothetical protein
MNAGPHPFRPTAKMRRASPQPPPSACQYGNLRLPCNIRPEAQAYDRLQPHARNGRTAWEHRPRPLTTRCGSFTRCRPSGRRSLQTENSSAFTAVYNPRCSATTGGRQSLQTEISSAFTVVYGRFRRRRYSARAFTPGQTAHKTTTLLLSLLSGPFTGLLVA